MRYKSNKMKLDVNVDGYLLIQKCMITNAKEVEDVQGDYYLEYTGDILDCSNELDAIYTLAHCHIQKDGQYTRALREIIVKVMDSTHELTGIEEIDSSKRNGGVFDLTIYCLEQLVKELKANNK